MFPPQSSPPPALANIQAIHAYVPGKPIEELKREIGLDNIIKLASNENPLGYSPKVTLAIHQAMSESHDILMVMAMR